MGKIKFKGFTLVELLVVMSIIGILSTITFVGIRAARERSNVTKAKTDIGRIGLAVTMLYSDTRYYPGQCPVLELKKTGWFAPSHCIDTNNSGHWYLDIDYNYTGLIDAPSPAWSNWNGPYYKGSVTDPWGQKYQIDYRYIGRVSTTATDNPKFHVAVVSLGQNGVKNNCDDIYKSLSAKDVASLTSYKCLNYQGIVD
ncbi:MAG: type II secretion system protein GspG [bacterium]|nr:type II secretion system protein GspG [bacterium]